MQEYFVVHVADRIDVCIAKVEAADEENARVKGYALILGVECDEIDLDNLDDETVTAILVADLIT